MRIRVLLPLLLLLMPALAAPAWAQTAQAPQPAPDAQALERDQQRAEAWQGYVLRVAKALGRSDGARDLALATLLEASARPYDPARAKGLDVEAWRTAAATRGAGDTITQQLLLAAGITAGDEAATAAAARRWQALEAGNLAPLLLQGLTAEGTLAAAAQSDRNAPDPYPLQRWIAATLRRHPPSASEWAAMGEGAQPADDVHATVWAASFPALLAPDYREVLGACTGRQLRAAGRAEACGHMSRLLLMRPQTVLDERIGLSMARALTRSAAERAPLDARRRGVDWRQEQMAELARREDAGATDARAYARALADATIDSEDAMVRRILSEARLAQEPPADWLAPWQQRR